MVKSAQFRKIPIAALVAGVVLFSHAQPADAWWFTRDERLGRLTTADNMNYWQQKGGIPSGTPPVDRNKLCQWKYGNNNVWGKAVSSSQPGVWQTDCYRWRWFWQ
ncbi:hypothetical protein [Planktothricoides raciborskii]|uniref:Uncharacterized protein n=1 Tax=Planktothricoides raciborskii FACHB-1370 TaxID=2949576 RepID=A0ABR8EM59_9CYAN|nr:hypothetical protein [Planktothricoides raciborskii]MBD2547003.1 hypothetical protein [Planktothricoides raciborskii FACHB-1370]MBD2584624.1 hypothetical protein [Planktothricoides raciborskii FACHB-1261]